MGATVSDLILRFGEITLKGRNRSWFENMVIHRIRGVLKRYPKARLERSYGRAYVKLNGEPYEPMVEALSKIFGLYSFSPVRKCELAIEQIQELARLEMQEYNPLPGTFKVTVRRTNKSFPYDTNALNPLIGGYVLSCYPSLKVDVHHPQVEIRVEVREDGAYVFSKTIPGPKGFPLGSNGKSMLMLSGGIDSPVAGFMAMRKGLAIEAVHFHSMPYTSERARQKVIDLTRKLAVYGNDIHLHLVPFTSIQLRLKEEGADNLLISLMRRAMFRITEMLAEKHGAKAIVTGESLGQVASQTLPSLHAIGQVVGMPILRPLIMMDKEEIIRMANQIGTYELSILPYEDCCTLFVPKSPSTNPNLRVIAKIEQASPWLDDSLREAVEQTHMVVVTERGVMHEREGDQHAHLF